MIWALTVLFGYKTIQRHYNHNPRISGDFSSDFSMLSTIQRVGGLIPTLLLITCSSDPAWLSRHLGSTSEGAYVGDGLHKKILHQNADLSADLMAMKGLFFA